LYKILGSLLYKILGYIFGFLLYKILGFLLNIFGFLSMRENTFLSFWIYLDIYLDSFCTRYLDIYLDSFCTRSLDIYLDSWNLINERKRPFPCIYSTILFVGKIPDMAHYLSDGSLFDFLVYCLLDSFVQHTWIPFVQDTWIYIWIPLYNILGFLLYKIIGYIFEFLSVREM